MKKVSCLELIRTFITRYIWSSSLDIFDLKLSFRVLFHLLFFIVLHDSSIYLSQKRITKYFFNFMEKYSSNIDCFCDHNYLQHSVQNR